MRSFQKSKEAHAGKNWEKKERWELRSKPPFFRGPVTGNEETKTVPLGFLSGKHDPNSIARGPSGGQIRQRGTNKNKTEKKKPPKLWVTEMQNKMGYGGTGGRDVTLKNGALFFYLFVFILDTYDGIHAYAHVKKKNTTA